MAADLAVNHYDVLGISDTAGLDEIEAAYRAGLARIKASLASKEPLPAGFLDRLRGAYMTLRNAELRRDYDDQRRYEQETRHRKATKSDMPFKLFAAPTIQADTSGPLRFEFVGTGGDYFRIWIVNLALSVLTLGIYSAWAKVRREQFFHRNTLLAGSGFDYHGNPKAILKGRLIAWTLLGLMAASKEFNPILYGVLLLCAVPILPWLLMRSFKFRAANTSFRGLRFRHRGTYGGAFVAFVLHGLPALFGLWLPMWMRAIRRFQLGKLSFGKTEFTCAPTIGGFYWAYIKAAVLWIVVMALILVAMFVLLSPIQAAPGAPGDPLGMRLMSFVPIVFFLALTLIIRPYLSVQLANLTWNATMLGDKTFTCTQTYGSYLRLVVGNFLMVVLTLGLFWPWAKVREARYRFERLTLESTDLDAFAGQAGNDSQAVGEEIADAFDLDFSL